jgi:hypothetical protein
MSARRNLGGNFVELEVPMRRERVTPHLVSAEDAANGNALRRALRKYLQNAGVALWNGPPDIAARGPYRRRPIGRSSPQKLTIFALWRRPCRH